MIPARTLITSRPDFPRHIDGTRVLRSLSELPPAHIQLGHSRHVPPGAPYSVYATVCRGDRSLRADFTDPTRPCGNLPDQSTTTNSNFLFGHPLELKQTTHSGALYFAASDAVGPVDTVLITARGSLPIVLCGLLLEVISPPEGWRTSNASD
jgi:hypothetical protein